MNWQYFINYLQHTLGSRRNLGIGDIVPALDELMILFKREYHVTIQHIM